jgi:hypothetical protein
MYLKLIRSVEATILFIFSGFIVGCINNAGDISQTAQKVIPTLSPADQESIQLIPVTDNPLYYYAEGVQIQLTPSLKWISVKFVSDDQTQRSAALHGSIVDPMEQARQIPVPELSLLPLQEGLTMKQLIDGIKLLRNERSSFLQVNPVFQVEKTEMIITDQFIATFSADKGKEEIDTINSLHGVEIVEPIQGQVNTFILRVTEKAGLDALSMANLYQESGLAVYAAPNFIRITQN